MTTREFDLITIGGGAAALGAARAATWLGKTAAIVSDGPIGGDCTFTGCVPSKTLIAQSKTGAGFTHAMTATRDAVARIAATEDAAALAREGITVIEGRGTLTNANTVEVGGTAYRARFVAVATGANAYVPPIDGIDDITPLTNESLWQLDEMPDRLAVLGGGPIGCEMALALSRFGIRVTLYEMLDRVLIREEPEASAVALQILQDAGVDVRLGTSVDRIERRDGIERVGASDGSWSEVDRVLVSVGRKPVSSGFGLEELGVETDASGYVVADDRLRTSVDGVFAIGDVNGRLPFTHAADEMGRLAAGHMFRKGPRWRFDEAVVPWVTFLDPEIARVGVTEAEAAGSGGRVAYLPLSEVDRAITDGRETGFIKIVTQPKLVTRGLFGGRVTGATIVAPRAGEMIHELALAVRTKMFAGRVGQLVHAYPTWSVGTQQAMAQFFYEVGGRKARKARRR